MASSDRVFQEMLHGTGGAEVGLTQETLQLDLHYRDSSLSRSLAEDCGVRAGDRAPDAPCLDMAGRVVRLFDVFRGPHFTLLGFGESCAPALRAVAAAGVAGVRTCLLGEHPAAYQLTGDTLVLVRPDGYVGLTARGHDGDAVLDYLGAVLTGALPAAVA